MPFTSFRTYIGTALKGTRAYTGYVITNIMVTRDSAKITMLRCQRSSFPWKTVCISTDELHFEEGRVRAHGRVKRSEIAERIAILGKKVVTSSGAYVGKVYDVHVEEATWYISHLYIRNVHWFRPREQYLVSRKYIVDITAVAVVIDDIFDPSLVATKDSLVFDNSMS